MVKFLFRERRAFPASIASNIPKFSGFDHGAEIAGVGTKPESEAQRFIRY